MSLATPFSPELLEGGHCASCLPDPCGCLITTMSGWDSLCPIQIWEDRAFSGRPMPPLCLLTLLAPAAIFSHILAYCYTELGRKRVSVGVSRAFQKWERKWLRKGRCGGLCSVDQIAFVAPQSSGDGVSWAVPWTEEGIYSLNWPGRILELVMRGLSLCSVN